MPSHPSFDADVLRGVLGHFATGVTVITTRDTGRQRVGVTANSFNSVSLDPPLVLWSLSRQSSSHAAFTSARYWAVHVLSEAQEALSRRFASRSIDRFAGLDIEEGHGGTPLLSGCAARFECETFSLHESGDHTVLIGRVLAVDQRAGASPLVFHGGRYRHLAEPSGSDQSAAGLAAVLA
ncbi:flavin reductase family protein [Pandoraea bronchicola]|uniref:Flavin reductase-like, FMN-binding protein n=1 Tax=Pandoraea bronchicola TaxID=2508287 RepID=A0A5E5BY06_9BURK|nr:flavin reductase family protein [Pandoraea bronchicola]VVE90494.1 flavin reductase-like, FMN-binding protein [Pandoraea bronchicola]